MASLYHTMVSHRNPKASLYLSQRRKELDHLVLPNSPKALSFSNSFLPLGKNPTMVSHRENIVLEEEQADHMQTKSTNSKLGIGIIRFIQGKHLFITGATGFLAKVLIEKILRTVPDVGRIYMLIKAKDKEAALNRLKNEILYTDLFKPLQEIHGKSYEAYTLTKLIPVIGDVREVGLGIQPELAEEISGTVDVIINSAAITRMNERYDVALDVNTMGPYRLMTFTNRFKRLKLFLHVSTAYVNGRRQGRVLEKPFCMGDTIAREISPDSSGKFLPFLDIETELKLAFGSRNNIRELKELGLTRAHMYGWHDSYTFTKAMGEMVINSMRGDIPVVTVRPAVIESTFKDPFPGWIEGIRMVDPIIVSYGEGQLTGFLFDPSTVLDLVPVDMVANSMLAAMAKHGESRDSSKMHVYHIASSVVNPLVLMDLLGFFYKHFSASPIVGSKGRPVAVAEMKHFTDMDEFFSYVQNEMNQRDASPPSEASNVTPRRVYKNFLKFPEQAKHLAKMYRPYLFHGGRFDITNTEKLMEEMSEDEKLSFGFDVRVVNWEDYITNIHIPGLRKHVMKERDARE